MLFRDRRQAGRALAARLTCYADRCDVIVLALPRGGVVVGFEVAAMLHAPLEVFLVRKLGMPGQEELGLGAIASGGIRVLNESVIEDLNVSGALIETISVSERRELEQRERIYRGNRPFPDMQGQTAVLIDDGIATGATMRAAALGLRQLRPNRIVIAVPVAPFSTCMELRRVVDEVVCIAMPELFYAIGQWYDNFDQVTDEQVVEILEKAAQPLPLGKVAGF